MNNPIAMAALAASLVFASSAQAYALSPAVAAGQAAAAYQPKPEAGALYPAITAISPPEHGFYSKELDYKGILIKSSPVVSDAALYAAYDIISMELAYLPVVAENLADAKAEVHIIGKDQVTSDLPEYRQLKGKPQAFYDGLTIDQRTRGLGGLWTSCGEENLLHLPGDRYAGRSILVHEFAHNIRDNGVQHSIVKMFDAQYKASLASGHWVGAYSATNPDEYFAELTMWYFGTHGDEHMSGAKPADGRAGLKAYDPQAYALFDDFYTGKIAVDHLKPRPHHYGW